MDNVCTAQMGVMGAESKKKVCRLASNRRCGRANGRMQDRRCGAGYPIDQGRFAPGDIAENGAPQCAEKADCAAKKNQSHLLSNPLQSRSAFCAPFKEIVGMVLAGNGEDSVNEMGQIYDAGFGLMKRVPVLTKSVSPAHTPIQPKYHACPAKAFSA